ncbi:MAG: hypothetical protein KDJ52_23755 [Anaerolineae bacterium]|nr:hypothetical protein [Anaerolineae bacterium]
MKIKFFREVKDAQRSAYNTIETKPQHDGAICFVKDHQKNFLPMRRGLKFMKKLMSLFGWSSRSDHTQRLEEPLFPSLPATEGFIRNTEEATRPTYRVTKRKTTDIHRVIDLSG